MAVLIKPQTGGGSKREGTGGGPLRRAGRPPRWRRHPDQNRLVNRNFEAIRRSSV